MQSPAGLGLQYPPLHGYSAMSEISENSGSSRVVQTNEFADFSEEMFRPEVTLAQGPSSGQGDTNNRISSIVNDSSSGLSAQEKANLQTLLGDFAAGQFNPGKLINPAPGFELARPGPSGTPQLTKLGEAFASILSNYGRYTVSPIGLHSQVGVRISAAHAAMDLGQYAIVNNINRVQRFNQFDAKANFHHPFRESLRTQRS